MSLSLSLDNRKHLERRMNLRSSTVNQRLVDHWCRKIDIPAHLEESTKVNQQVINKCESHHQKDINCVSSKITKEYNDNKLAKYDRHEEFKFNNFKPNDHHSRYTLDTSNCNCGFKQFHCLCQEDNNDSNISTVNSSTQGESRISANYDLSNSSKRHFEPVVDKLGWSNSFTQNQSGQAYAHEMCLKRIKNSCNDVVESHNIDEVVCSCRDKTNEVLETPINSRQISHNGMDIHFYPERSPEFNSKPRNRILIQPHKLVSLSERNGRTMCNKHMPWFGIDIGGSLVKVVFFDPKDATKEETVTLKRIRRYLKSSKAYGTTGKRDAHLEMPNCVINKRIGTLHFIRFATNQMPDFLAMAKNKRFTDTINNVCATGGGANKFEEDIKTNLGITLHKTDELDSIIHGIHYIDKYNPERECYFLKDPLDDVKCVKVPYDFSRPYPYLVVNIGSGVSILAVYSSTSYSRISGSSIGGGTFLGLCCLLTQCKTFDEAIRLANNGSSTKIDKLVKDIYGGDYPKFNLSGDTVASSFGHMNVLEKSKGVKREDLARALLEMVTINIGSISRMCAMNENIDRVVFIGNFLRVNQLSMKLLSYAVNYWSKGAIKALFLEHEGYFGAVGCFVESTNGCCHN